jgi:predicted MPP superfamily phosphohydrolase
VRGRHGERPIAPPTRSPLRRALAAFALLGLALAAFALLIEPRRLVVTRAELELPAWPRALDGLRVALISDLHVGSPHWDLAALERLVARTNAEAPELVLLAGDYEINGVLGGTHVPPEPIAARLAALRAPLGVFAVLGNHDWWNDGERTRRAFTAAGITVLEEDSRAVERGGARVHVVGLADQMTRPSRPAAALATVPRGEPSLLLVHEPDVFATLADAPSLTLAGHTHGGQIRLPFVGSPVVPSAYGQRYARGHVVEDGRHLFVTSGVGTSIYPVRLFVPPEIALLTLRAPR